MKRFFLSALSLFILTTVFSQSYYEQAQTPPMGWNSWNCFRCNDLNEENVKKIADAMVERGMVDVGYEYLVLDDCWQIDRDKEGNIVVDKERFPSGMKALGDYIHSKGLKFGIYSCAGSKTCQQRPGSRGYQFQDARQYAEWGVDYLKYDWCFNESQDQYAAYKTMRDALIATGRPIVFSICEWGSGKPWTWGEGIGHLWRTTGDIRDCWDCDFGHTSGGVVKILDINKKLRNHAGPGHWNDPDMLEVGNEGLNMVESKAHFSLWCMMAAPLMAGNDLSTMNEEVAEILTNEEMIAIDQDPLGIQCRVLVSFENGEIEIYEKHLDDGRAVCIFNRMDEEYEFDFTWAMFEIEDNYKIRDVWAHKDLSTTHKNRGFKITLPAHGVEVYRLTNLK